MNLPADSALCRRLPRLARTLIPCVAVNAVGGLKARSA